MRAPAALVALALASAPAAAEVVVRVSGGHVELTATAAPLADVLDRLARQTGMKVVYEGPAPRQLVTLSLHGRTPTETILSVFEGLGVNFALVADPSGSRVQTLVVAGTATASSSGSSSGAGRPVSPATVRRPFGPPPGASPETIDPAFEEADEEPAGEEETFAGLPPGAEVTEPSGVPMAPPDPALANPAAQVPPPGRGGTHAAHAGLLPVAVHAAATAVPDASARGPPGAAAGSPTPDDSGTPTSPPPP